MTGTMKIFIDGGGIAGHAYVAIVENGIIDYYGFYPVGDIPWERYDGPGEVRHNFDSDRHTRFSATTSERDFDLNDAQLTAVRNYIADKTAHPPHYNAVGNGTNCVDFDQGLVNAAGINQRVGDMFTDAEQQKARGAGEYANWMYGDSSLFNPLIPHNGLYLHIGPLSPFVAYVVNAFTAALSTYSPLIIDLNGDGFHFNNYSTIGSDAYFDLTGNHFATHTSWDTGVDGFLARDLNGDGKINDITEIFGENGGTSAWAKLAALDSNASGTITSADTAWSSLKIWVDANHNGRTDSGELQSLAQAGITSITLQQNSNQSTVDGQTLSGNATVTLNGVGHTMTDAFFTSDPIDSWWIGDGTAASTNIDPETIFLPLSRGYGVLPSWHYAMTQDTALKTIAQQIEAVSPTNPQQLYELTASFLYEWAGVTNLNSASRGSYIDARKLVFLEKELNTPFLSIYGDTNPQGLAQATPLLAAWQMGMLEFHDRLAVQGPLLGVFLNASYDFATDKLAFGESVSDIVARAATVAPAYSSLMSWSSFWSEVGGILTRHAADLGQTSAQIATALDNAAGHHVTVFDNVMLYTPQADNVVISTTGNNYVSSGDGDDYIAIGGTGRNLIDGGNGNDILTGDVGANTLIGGAGNDFLSGADGGDTYVWGAG